jgi:hypothetical protein
MTIASQRQASPRTLPKTDALARRLVAELGAVVRDRPHRWVMLSDLWRLLGVSWEETEAAAEFAVSQGWVERTMHSVILLEGSRQTLKAQKLRSATS